MFHILFVFLAFDLNKIANPVMLQGLTPAEKMILAEYGYVARPSPSDHFYEIYKQARTSSQPIFVTVDGILHTYHILYDYSLRELEIKYLKPDLTLLLEKMIERTNRAFKEVDKKFHPHLIKNLAYLSVPYKILNPKWQVPKRVVRLVQDELALINGHKGFVKSPIFGYLEDYSQYKPRGHYTRSKDFEDYFKAMMWLGRMTFLVKPGPEAGGAEKGIEQTICALLILKSIMCTCTGEDLFPLWQKINDPIVLYVGKADDLTIAEYKGVKEKIFPQTKMVDLIKDRRMVEKFIDAVMKLRPPGIISGFVTDQEKPEVSTRGLRLFGQKFIPDSYIFQQLVYDKVGTVANPRKFPKGLDLFAVLGSERAYEILTKVYKEDQYANYISQMAKLRKEFSDLKDDTWYSNLYWGWLYVLKAVIAPVPEFLPAWADRCLSTALGSWAELRHDTILYAKQSYTVFTTSVTPQPELVRGYVEPNPTAFERIKRLVDTTRVELKKREILSPNIENKLTAFSDLLKSLQTISEKETRGLGLTEDDYIFIQGIGSRLEDLITVPGMEEYTTEADKSSALIADVHTDPNTKMVLEAGNDRPAYLYVLVRNKKQFTLMVGAIYNYYEFLQPMEARLTDEEWQSLTPKPAKPEWMKFFTLL
ncbi:MAG: DUF3160 domain-containing protein [candidate division WOR-3 bacterium]